ncbi:MAG: Fur family transcriptional regulator [Candidatus Brocadiia bacterium]
MGRCRDAKSGDVMQLLSDICRQAGLKLTRQRVEVLRELAHSGDRATLEKIDRRLQARFPTLSRRTVRRALGEFERVGIIREVDKPALQLRGSSRRR